MKRILAALSFASLSFPALSQPVGADVMVDACRVNGLPDVASDAKGNFVVVCSGGADAGFRLVGQRFDASGDKLGAAFRVSELQAEGSPAVRRAAPRSRRSPWALAASSS
jgi:hypothetical protein